MLPTTTSPVAIPTRIETSGNPRRTPIRSGNSAWNAGNAAICSSAARQASRACSSAPVKGGPQNAITASPIYLSMMPRLRRTGSEMTLRYRFSTLTRPTGVIPSLKLVNPFMSQNRIVISRREPLGSVNSGRSISPATMRGSTYLPNVSRICSLARSSPTMLLKAWVSRPISSCEVTGTTVSSSPCSHGCGAGQEPPHRPLHSHAHAGRHEHSDQRGDDHQEEPNPDDPLLIGAGAEDGIADDGAHFLARHIHPLTPVVAPLVEPDPQAIRSYPISSLGSSQPLAETALGAPLHLLQEFDMRVEPGQRNVVVEIQVVGDLLVDALPRGGQFLPASRSGLGYAGTQFRDVFGVARLRLVAVEQRRRQPARGSGFFELVDVRLRQRDDRRHVMLVDDHKLRVDGAGHAQIDPGDRAHQDQKPDGDAENFETDGQAHRASDAHAGVLYFVSSVQVPYQLGLGGCSRKWATRARKTRLGPSAGSRSRHLPKPASASSQACLR